MGTALQVTPPHRDHSGSVKCKGVPTNLKGATALGKSKASRLPAAGFKARHSWVLLPAHDCAHSGSSGHLEQGWQKGKHQGKIKLISK